MADADLEEIRKARLAQLQQGGGGGGPSRSGGFPGAGGDDGEEQRNAENEARQSVLSQILEPEAADRLGRIRMVKESRATDVENRLIMLARSGQLRARVSEKQLKEILEALNEQEAKKSGGSGGGGGGPVVVNRRRGGWDDEDDELDLDDL